MNQNNNEMFQVSLLLNKRREPGAEYMEDTVYGAVAETSDRFTQAASLLPKGECLGWQISPGKEEVRVVAFSGPEARVTREDLDWVFHRCAALGSASRAPLERLWGEDRRVYVLREGQDDPEAEQSARGRFPNEGVGYEFLKALEKRGAILRITAGGGTGSILLSLPGEITLRMRAMLALAFPGTEAAELGVADPASPLPAKRLAAVMTGLLGGLMLEPADRESSLGHTGNAPSAPPVSGEDMGKYAGDPPEGVEDLDISVRTLNCLMRAGINTVEELRRMSDADLERVRSLGRKGIEEIHEELARWGLTPTQPENPGTLEELIGLENVKEQVRKITALAKMWKDLEAQGKSNSPMALNMEFVGNPGTAKTTVARILAGTFHEIGLLPSNELVEVGRTDLVGKFVGHTANQVRNVFRRAKGKVLFIDEAYALADDRAGNFGDEAINTIVQEMENNRKDTIVIFAGYPEQMEELFSRNPGLRSRVPYRISFSDYSPEEMTQIADLEAEKRGFSIGPEAREKVAALCEAAAGRPELGNGRFCRNLVESALLGYASRVYGTDAPDAEKNFVLSAADFALPEPPEEPKKEARIGFSV